MRGRYSHDAERGECQRGDQRTGSAGGQSAEDVARRHQRGTLPEPFGAGEPEYLDGSPQPDRRGFDRLSGADCLPG